MSEFIIARLSMQTLDKIYRLLMYDFRQSVILRIRTSYGITN